MCPNPILNTPGPGIWSDHEEMLGSAWPSWRVEREMTTTSIGKMVCTEVAQQDARPCAAY